MRARGHQLDILPVKVGPDVTMLREGIDESLVKPPIDSPNDNPFASLAGEVAELLKRRDRRSRTVQEVWRSHGATSGHAAHLASRACKMLSEVTKPRPSYQHLQRPTIDSLQSAMASIRTG